MNSNLFEMYKKKMKKKYMHANTLTIARSRQVKIENWKRPKLRK